METPKLRVAVVDDEPSVRKALRRMLQTSGIDVTLFASGEDFLHSIIKERSVDVALIDVRLGRMSGFEVREQLVKASVALPAVFITGSLDANLARQAQPCILLRKPLSSEALLAAIASAIQSNRR